MRGVRAGRLKDKLTIQTAVRTKGPYGGYDEEWSNVATRSCEIRPLRAAEFFAASGEQVEALYEIRFRYEKDIFNHANRLRDTKVSPNRVFDIQAIINTGNWNSEIVITAVERQWPIRG